MSAMGTTNKSVSLMKLAFANIRERMNASKVAKHTKVKNEEYKERMSGIGASHTYKRIASMFDVYLDADAIARAGQHKFQPDKTIRDDGKPGCEVCGHNSFKTVRKPTHKSSDKFSIRELREIECRNPECKHRIFVPIY